MDVVIQEAVNKPILLNLPQLFLPPVIIADKPISMFEYKVATSGFYRIKAFLVHPVDPLKQE